MCTHTHTYTYTYTHICALTHTRTHTPQTHTRAHTNTHTHAHTHTHAGMGRPYKTIKTMFERNRWRIVEGDEVVIRGTKFSGQIGKVLAVLKDPRVPQVVVEGINLVSALSMTETVCNKKRSMNAFPVCVCACALCSLTMEGLCIAVIHVHAKVTDLPVWICPHFAHPCPRVFLLLRLADCKKPQQLLILHKPLACLIASFITYCLPHASLPLSRLVASLTPHCLPHASLPPSRLVAHITPHCLLHASLPPSRLIASFTPHCLLHASLPPSRLIASFTPHCLFHASLPPSRLVASLTPHCLPHASLPPSRLIAAKEDAFSWVNSRR